MTFWTFQILNGVSFGMLLFLLAAGLSLIYGLMRILNLAHGSYYILGAYVALSVGRATGSLVLAAAAGTVAGVVLGIVMERVFLRRVPRDELPQALLTFGLIYLAFGLIVNAVLLYITDKLIDDFKITGLGPLFGAAGLISVAAWLLPRIF